ncbi:MAG: prepilin-type N-terminal cleavage/methylation domain-containing protein [Sulfuricella sp.]
MDASEQAGANSNTRPARHKNDGNQRTDDPSTQALNIQHITSFFLPESPRQPPFLLARKMPNQQHKVTSQVRNIKMKTQQSGFTLIEIAIVLVIIGLLLGGVLKGQELITSARVRNMISQQDGIKAAYFGFLDRYRALPGDYSAAIGNIKDVTKAGDGDGQIELTNGTNAEYILVWEHLSKAGFINGSYIYSATVADSNTPKNPYSGYLQLRYDANYGDPTATNPARHNLKTGNQVPVSILAEVDRKIDDGLPYSGAFQFSDYVVSGGTAPTVTGTAKCIVAASGTTPAQWDISTESTNCGGASIF